METKTKVAFLGTAEQEAELLAAIEEMKDLPGALMPVMQKAQEIYGYTFKDLGNWEGNIRVAASCQNVFVLSNYSGIDPEINSTDGVDRTFWPRPRTYAIRLNINF